MAILAEGWARGLINLDKANMLNSGHFQSNRLAATTGTQFEGDEATPPSPAGGEFTDSPRVFRPRRVVEQERRSIVGWARHSSGF
jgi:hypothetical protein